MASGAGGAAPKGTSWRFSVKIRRFYGFFTLFLLKYIKLPFASVPDDIAQSRRRRPGTSGRPDGRRRRRDGAFTCKGGQ